MRTGIPVIALWMALAVPADAGTLSGRASVESGDTLVVADRTVKLAGIAAPPPRQRCRIYDVQWPCGHHAKVALQRLVAGGELSCAIEEESATAVVAVCLLDGEDIGERMVRAGHARARERYGEAQLEAQRHSRGVWGGLMPERPE